MWSFVGSVKGYRSRGRGRSRGRRAEAGPVEKSLLIVLRRALWGVRCRWAICFSDFSMACRVFGGVW